MDRLQHRLEDLLGLRVAELQPLSGGDTAQAFKVSLADGRSVFAKTHAAPPDGFFSREAADLLWLSEAGALPVPEVLAVSDHAPACLILEWIPAGSGQGRHRGNAEAEFGRNLAALHLSGAPCFGRADGRTTGSLALPNNPAETWSEFFADRRLLPLARIAFDRAALPSQTITGVEETAGRLEALGGPPEPPARLHGDLWAGNRMVDDHGRSWLIDPAAHGGHREFDLAMMQLFGGFGNDAFIAYDQTFPLADGWEQRIKLHQLAPLIVHAIKFGGGYVSAVQGALDGLSP